MSHASVTSNRSQPPGDDIDVATLLAGVGRRKKWIVLPTLAALLCSTAFVFLATPRYTASSDILIENRDTLYTAPGSEAAQTTVPERLISEDVVQSQAQLVLARDASLEVIRSLSLGALPEFDPALDGPSALGRILVLLRLQPAPTNASPEDRVLNTFLDKVVAYPQRGSRIVTIEATSQDPELAAKIANSLANEYMKRETRAKQDTAVQASGFLLGEINTLRSRVTEAEAAVEAFRSQQGLLQGQNSTTITTLQLSELSTQLANARSRQADLIARARLIREALNNGRIFEVTEINNNELVRRLLEQRSILQGQLALEERIYLPQHPRIKELSAQIRDLESQIRNAAERTARGLENDARAALARVEQLNQDINAQKTVASTANGAEVQLRQLEREAKALRDQLETYLARYNDAQARDRENSVAADARIVSQAIVPSTPTFPKKVPIIAIATGGTLFLSTILLISAQLLGAATGRSRARENESVYAQDDDVQPQSFEPMRPAQPRQAPARPAPAMSFAPPAPANSAVSGIDFPAAVPQTPRLQPASVPESAARAVPSALPLDARIVLEPNSAAATAIRRLADALRAHRLSGRAACALVVADQMSSASPSAAIGLARVLMREGKTILVDLNPKSTAIARIVADASPTGLGDVLAGRKGFAEAIHRDRGSRAHVMPLGANAPDPCSPNP